MTITPRPTPSPWAGRARDCLTAAMSRDQAAIQRAATALVHEFGPEVLPQVMLAWVDTALAAQGVTPMPGKPATLMFGNVDTGKTATDADDVRPEVAWSGRLVNARIACDEDGYRALMAAVPDGQDAQYVTALLDCCAHTVRLGRAIRAARK